MDIGSLSDQELLNFIILLGTGVVVFAGVFVVVLGFYVRSQRAADKRASANTPNRANSPFARASRDTMGSLLKSTDRKNQEPSLDVGAPADVPTQALPSSTGDAEYRELLRVLVDSSGEKIVIEVDGKRYEAISQVKDRSIGQRILETAAALLGFTDGYIATVGGVKMLPTPEVKLTVLPSEFKPAPVEPVKVSPSAPSAPSAAAEEFLADIEAARRDFPQQGPPEKSSFLGRAFGQKDKSTAEAEIPSFNLADEIDEIVQRKLRQANDRTRVKIHSGAGGMVQFQVVDKMYESVDQVEDTGIQAIIKSAIEEWSG